MAEGSEDDGFWSALGGQADYQKARDLDKPLLYPRLFHCTISPAGCLRVNEVANFGQEVSVLVKIIFFVLSSWLLIPSSVVIVITIIMIIIPLCIFISHCKRSKCSFQDLNEDDVMVLDSGDEVYVWIGRGSDDQEKEKAFEMAEVN